MSTYSLLPVVIEGTRKARKAATVSTIISQPSGALDEKTLLKAETVNSMFQNNIGDIQPAALATVMPTLSNTADMSFGDKATFGLGLLLHTDGINGGRKANTGSWAGLFNSYYWVDREAGTYGIFGTQVLPFYDGVAIETLLEFEQAVY